MGSVVLGARIGLACVFAVAAVGKLLDLGGTRRGLQGFGLAEGTARVAGVVLPIAELVACVALLIANTAVAGGVLAAGLLVVFMLGIARALLEGKTPECHCFGRVHSSPAGWETLLRNAALAVVAGVVVGFGPGSSIPSWLDHHDAASVVALASTLLAAALTMAAVSLRTDKRRLNTRLVSLEAIARRAPIGLPVGAPAPDFALSDTRGDQITLANLLGAGRPAVLVFADPRCEPCRAVLPDVSRWQVALASDATIAVVSSGGGDDNEGMAAAYQLSRVLVQADTEVLDAYRIRGTPSAVVIDAEGTIARPTATGPRALEELIRLTVRGQPVMPAVESGLARG